MSESEVGTQEVAVEAAPVEAPSAPSTPDAATLARQLSAADAARVKAQNEAAQAVQDRDAARKELAARDEADMSELEKAQKERDRFKAEAEQARADAERIRLNALYPHAAAEFEGEPLPSEERLKSLETKLRPAAAAAEAEPTPTIKSNPAKVRAEAPAETLDEKRARVMASWPAEHASHG